MKDKDVVILYNDYGFGVYLPPKNQNDFDVYLPPRKGNDIEPVETDWEHVKFWAVTRKMKEFKERIIRFSEDNEMSEKELLSELRFRESDLEKTRKEMWSFLMSPNEDFIDYVVECKDLEILKSYYGEMVYLTNTNCYQIPEKNKLYLKGRMEELSSGLIKSDLRPTPNNDILGIFEETQIEAEEVEVEVEVKEEVEVKKAETKKRTPVKRTTKKTK